MPCAFSLVTTSLRAANLDEDEFQMNVNPHHPLTDRLDLFGNIGAAHSSDYNKYRLGWPGLVYHTSSWLQLWGGFDVYYKDYDQSADELELRPGAGLKLFVPNRAKIVFFNFTRYEYRDFQNQNTHDWSGYSRIRSRFGVEVPLTSRAEAWQPKTFYLLAQAEPFYRFDKNEWDPVWLRSGLGYVLNSHMRAELIYTAQFKRSSPGSSLEYNNNMIELNIKIGFKRGVLDRLFNPGE